MFKPSSGLEVEISRIDVTYVGPGPAVNGYGHPKERIEE
jgi:hypothetical protein